MTPDDFINGSPCLEEIDGYMFGLRWQIDNAERLKIPAQFDEITSDILKPIEDYRRKLLKGEVVPAATKLPRRWKYAHRRKPVPVAAPPPMELGGDLDVIE